MLGWLEVTGEIFRRLKEVSRGDTFYTHKNEFDDLNNGLVKLTRVIVESDGDCDVSGTCKRTTNLSTIKSQISKGRQLVIKKIERKFNHLDTSGLNEI